MKLAEVLRELAALPPEVLRERIRGVAAALDGDVEQLKAVIVALDGGTTAQRRRPRPRRRPRARMPYEDARRELEEIGHEVE